MQHRHADFFDRAGPFTLRQIAEHVGATLLDDGAGAVRTTALVGTRRASPLATMQAPASVAVSCSA